MVPKNDFYKRNGENLRFGYHHTPASGCLVVGVHNEVAVFDLSKREAVLTTRLLAFAIGKRRSRCGQPLLTAG
jgi:hypothetical protein